MIAGLPSNIFLLFTAAPLLLCVSPVMIFAGTLLAKETAPTPELAALPVTVMIVTAALSMGPVVTIYQQLGRRKGTWVGVLCTVAGTSICFVAARQGWFAALVAGGFFYGVSQAFLHQYRFIGFESLANPEDFPKAFAVLMMSGVVSAWLGPEIAWQGKDLLEAPFGYAGSFLILLFLHLVAFVVLYRLQDPPVENTTAATGGRPLSQIVFQVPWLLSFLAAAIGFGVMASMMTSTPITMNSGGSFTLGARAAEAGYGGTPERRRRGQAPAVGVNSCNTTTARPWRGSAPRLLSPAAAIPASRPDGGSGAGSGL